MQRTFSIGDRFPFGKNAVTKEKEAILAQRDQDLEQAKVQHQQEVAALLREHAEKLQNARRHFGDEASQMQRQLAEANERLASVGNLVSDVH